VGGRWTRVARDGSTKPGNGAGTAPGICLASAAAGNARTYCRREDGRRLTLRTIKQHAPVPRAAGSKPTLALAECCVAQVVHDRAASVCAAASRQAAIDSIGDGLAAGATWARMPAVSNAIRNCPLVLPHGLMLPSWASGSGIFAPFPVPAGTGKGASIVMIASAQSISSLAVRARQALTKRCSVRRC
jgi:hypothetical protein